MGKGRNREDGKGEITREMGGGGGGEREGAITRDMGGGGGRGCREGVGGGERGKKWRGDKETKRNKGREVENEVVWKELEEEKEGIGKGETKGGI